MKLESLNSKLKIIMAYTNILQQQQQFQPNIQQQASISTLASPQQASPSTIVSSVQEHVIEKKQKTRYNAEFKAKILSQLETSSQADLARL